MAKILIDTDTRLKTPSSDYEKVVRREVGRILNKIQSKNLSPLVSVFLCSNGAIRKLNRRWLKKNRVTNVISFQSPDLNESIKKFGPVPIRKSGLSRYFRGKKGRIFLGDMALGIERARVESKSAGVHPMEWIAALAFHGMMHILGYSHHSMPERKL